MSARKKRIIVVAIAAIGAAAGLAALTGSEIVETGRAFSAKGILSEEGGEWYLSSGGSIYELHLGNYAAAYPEGFELNEGAEASVDGFAEGLDVAVTRISSEGRTYVLRDEDGVPAWAGKGRGRNARVDGGSFARDYPGRGRGRP